MESHQAATVTYRDLTADAPYHLAAPQLAAWRGVQPEDVALVADIALGNAIVEELFAADVIVIGAPMYNFAIASQLKSWFDRVLVPGKTFKYGINGPEPLLPPGKKIYIVSSRGGVYTGSSPAAPLEHQESYLLGTLGFLGLRDVEIVRAEGLAISPDARQAAIAQAQSDISALSV